MISFSSIDDVVAPDANDQELAKAGQAALAEAVKADQAARLTFVRSSEQLPEIAISPSIIRVLARVFDELAQGHAVTVIPLDEEITTQEAANLLLVSRPYFIGLLDQGELAFRKVGNQRRVRLREVLEYRRQQYERSTKAMHKLSKLSAEMGLYD